MRMVDAESGLAFRADKPDGILISVVYQRRQVARENNPGAQGVRKMRGKAQLVLPASLYASFSFKTSTCPRNSINLGKRVWELFTVFKAQLEQISSSHLAPLDGLGG